MSRLTERSAVELARAIRAREISARDVVEAHIDKLTQWSGVNAVVADRFDAARAEANSADALVAVAKDTDELPALLGVPCTVKESIAVAGMPNTAAVVSRRGSHATQSAPAVHRLIDAGAIVVGVTNPAELCLSWETDNKLYGRTVCVHDPARTAGGSSGGEGAAVGCGGSPIGVGSDIGGSIRTPAFFNGVFGHKPSRGLVSNGGQWVAPTGSASRMLTVGPLARRAEDLMPVLRALAGHDPADPDSRDVALGDPADVDLMGLRVTVAEGSTHLPLHRDLADARARAAGALEALGATVRTVSLRSLRNASTNWLAVLHTEYGPSIGELLAPGGAPARTLASAIRSREHASDTLLAGLDERLFRALPRPVLRRLLDAGHRMADELTEAVGDGVLLHPPFLRTAPRHGTTTAQPWLIGSLTGFNLAGLPVTQIPAGRNRKGLPLGVQVAAGLDRDHVSIRVAKELERALGGWIVP